MSDPHFVEQSDRIEIHLPDGRTLQGPRGVSAGSLLKPIDIEGVPDNSILRECIGGSILKDFKVWGSS
jgi:hypothetical protein